MWAALRPKRGSARSLLPVLDRQDAASHSLDQSLMVGFGLVRVGTGEAAQGPVQLVRRTDISGDHGGSARAGMSLGQQVADNPGVIGQRSRVDRIQ